MWKVAGERAWTVGLVYKKTCLSSAVGLSKSFSRYNIINFRRFMQLDISPTYKHQFFGHLRETLYIHTRREVPCDLIGQETVERKCFPLRSCINVNSRRFWRTVVGRDTFDATASSFKILLKITATSVTPSSSHGGQYDVKYVILELIWQAAFVRRWLFWDV